MDYPEDLHETHNSFPLAAEKKIITECMLSDYALDCHHILRGKETYKAEKLTSTFQPRKKYVTHYVNLQTYLSHGMRLRKVHRVLRFKQFPIFKSYIEYCTQKRSVATNKFEEELYKFLNNSIYGKTIENVRAYANCTFVTTDRQCKRRVTSPRFKNFKIIHDKCAVIYQESANVRLNKPIACGFTILEQSKNFMYRSYYEKLRPAFNGNCEVLLHDTDSFLMAVTTKKPMENITKIKEMLDFSKYDPKHKRFNVINKNKLGFFKDEMKGVPIAEVCSIRSKVYSLRIRNGKEDITENRCKGVKKATSKKITFQHYKRCLQTIARHDVTQYNIMSRSHVVHTTKAQKLAFSSFDDKRYLFTCGIHSVPYGSKYTFLNYCHYCAKKGEIMTLF